MLFILCLMTHFFIRFGFYQLLFRAILLHFRAVLLHFCINTCGSDDAFFWLAWRIFQYSFCAVLLQFCVNKIFFYLLPEINRTTSDNSSPYAKLPEATLGFLLPKWSELFATFLMSHFWIFVLWHIIIIYNTYMYYSF